MILEKETTQREIFLINIHLKRYFFLNILLNKYRKTHTHNLIKSKKS